jgi:cytochrome c oxidase subunit 3
VAYFVLRMRQPVWPPLGSPVLPQKLALLNTVVLLWSSFFLEMAIRKVEAKNSFAFKLFFALSLISGLAFLALQVCLWLKVSELGLSVEGSLGSLFYGFTWLHAAHMVAGLLALFSLIPGALRGVYLEKGALRVRLVAIFWHFLDIVWILLYLALFII